MLTREIECYLTAGALLVSLLGCQSIQSQFGGSADAARDLAAGTAPQESGAQTLGTLHRSAVARCESGDFRAAEHLFREALAAEPLNPQILCDYGYSCYLQGRYPEALAALQKSLRITPELSRARNNLGLVLASTGETDPALSQFELAGCSPAEGRVNLALALAKEGQKATAALELKQALRTNQSLDSARDLLAAIGAHNTVGADADSAPSPSVDTERVATAAFRPLPPISLISSEAQANVSQRSTSSPNVVPTGAWSTDTSAIPKYHAEPLDPIHHESYPPTVHTTNEQAVFIPFTRTNE